MERGRRRPASGAAARSRRGRGLLGRRGHALGRGVPRPDRRPPRVGSIAGTRRTGDDRGVVDAVRDVLDAAGVARAHVVGFSMGGLVAQALATGHPDRDRLVLASTYAVMNPQARLFLDAVRDVVAAGGSMRPVFPLVCPWLFSVDFLADPANAGWLTSPEGDDPTQGWLAQYHAQREFDGRSRLVDLSAVALERDGVDASPALRDFRESLADEVRRRLVERIGEIAGGPGTRSRRCRPGRPR
ncbi:alpha/beta fold hydrolase [Actinomycetospora sp. OC33-EN08]|uniref:Alpha/beta fold hydrolase n=1 Tax=Actinomycetospora aurantiaca TaxID=3129233 RepID=A0ABU8MLT0_9PSEU